MIPVFAVGTTVLLASPPGKRQGLCAGQRLGEGLPLTGKLLTNGASPVWSLSIRRMLNQSITAGSMEIFPRVLKQSDWYRIVTRDKGEVEEEEGREDVKRCRWQ